MEDVIIELPDRIYVPWSISHAWLVNEIRGWPKRKVQDLADQIQKKKAFLIQASLRPEFGKSGVLFEYLWSFARKFDCP